MESVKILSTSDSFGQTKEAIEAARSLVGDDKTIIDAWSELRAEGDTFVGYVQYR